MRCSQFIFIFSFFFISKSWSLDCRLAERLNFPDVAGNSKFWDEFSQLPDTTDFEVKKLFQKFGIDEAAPQKNNILENLPSLNQTYVINNKVKKLVDKLPEDLKVKFSEFVNEVNHNGFKKLYDNPGKWRFEQLNGTKTRTVRLNNGYRVEFIENDGVLEILDVGKHVSH